MREDIVSKIRKAGVVGAGGAGFPTHVKVFSAAETVIVNGAECEPLLRVDQLLMEAKADRLVEGLQAVMTATGAGQGVFALKAKYKGAAAALKKAITKSMRLHLLEDFYPAGDEHVLVYEAVGKVVPQGGIPLKAGCVVLNVETLVNVAAALEGKAVTHSYLTIAGEVPQPMTLKLPVGTSVEEALLLAGCKNAAGMAVIEGGPMMGKILDNYTQPITKTTKGLIVLPPEHYLITKKTLPIDRAIKQAKAVCMQCRYCTDLCPRFLLGHKLEPHKIMRSVKHLDSREEIMKMALACSECGLCEQYACSMNLSPRQVNAMLKREFLKQGIRPDLPPEEQAASLLREYRKVPVKRLIARLDLTRYDKAAPLVDRSYLIDTVKIKLKQKVGAPSLPVVEIGQRVNQGDVIAEIPGNSLGANLHASISGIVTEITDSIAITADGRSCRE